MKKLHRNPMVLASLLALGVAGGGTAALAAANAITDKDELREMRGVEEAGAKLEAVIADAQTRSNGRAVDAGAEDESGGVVYVVETMSTDGAIQEMRFKLDGTFISATPGDVEDPDEVKPIVAAKVSLADAVAKAVAETGGKALEASYDEEDGRLVIEAETTSGGNITEVVIDADSGAVLAKQDHADREGDDEEDWDEGFFRGQSPGKPESSAAKG